MDNSILEETINFRYLDQHVYPEQKLYRSGDLTHISQNVAEYLFSELGLRTFIDLRSQKEIRHYGKPKNLIDAGVIWVTASIEGYPNFSIRDPVPSPQSYAHYYFDILKCCVGQISIALEQISLCGHEPLAFGCHAGKDRTGLIAMCLMEIAGATKEQITEDYALTTFELNRQKAYFEDKWVKRKMDSDTYMRRVMAHPEAVESLYELLEGESMISHLTNLGLKPCIMNALRGLS